MTVTLITFCFLRARATWLDSRRRRQRGRPNSEWGPQIIHNSNQKLKHEANGTRNPICFSFLIEFDEHELQTCMQSDVNLRNINSNVVSVSWNCWSGFEKRIRHKSSPIICHIDMHSSHYGITVNISGPRVGRLRSQVRAGNPLKYLFLVLYAFLSFDGAGV